MAYDSKHKRPMSEINVVPFIDVMLVLLVIFMITTPLLSQGVKVDLPKTQAKAMPTQEKEPIIVTVDAQGLFYLNIQEKPEIPVALTILENVVRTELQDHGLDANPRPVMVRGDQAANYGKVVEAMAVLQRAGAKSVGLITDPQSLNAGAKS